MSAIITLAPRRAIRRAADLPMPEPPPVTMMTLSARLLGMVKYSLKEELGLESDYSEEEGEPGNADSGERRQGRGYRSGSSNRRWIQ